MNNNKQKYFKSLDGIKPETQLVNDIIQKIQQLKIEKAENFNSKTRFDKLKLIRALSMGVAATFVIVLIGVQGYKINQNTEEISNNENAISNQINPIKVEKKFGNIEMQVTDSNYKISAIVSKLEEKDYKVADVMYDMKNKSKTKTGSASSEDIKTIANILKLFDGELYKSENFPTEIINQYEYSLINLKGSNNTTTLIYVPCSAQNPIIITYDVFITAYIIDGNTQLHDDLEGIILKICEGLKPGDTKAYVGDKENSIPKKRSGISNNIVQIKQDNSLSIRFEPEYFSDGRNGITLDNSKINGDTEYIIKSNVKDFEIVYIGREEWPVLFYLLFDGTVEYMKFEEAVINGNCSVVHTAQLVEGAVKLESGQGSLRETQYGYGTIFAIKEDGSKVELVLNEIFK